MGNENTPLTLEEPSESRTGKVGSAATTSPPNATPATGSPEAASKIRIGDRLLAMGVITQDQLDVALREKSRAPEKMVGRILLEFGFITEDILTSLLAEATGFDAFNVSDALIDPEAVAHLPRRVAVQHRVLPISVGDEKAIVAMADPYDVLAVDQLRRYLPHGIEIERRVCTEDDLLAAIDRGYGYEMSIAGILAELETGTLGPEDGVADDDGYTHPLVRLVDAILLDAVKLSASDIHFEPEDLFVRLRYRQDGHLRQVHTFHKEHWSAMSHRLKIISGMNIADRLHPQDGRLTMRIGNREIDFRVSALPTVDGENIVLRVLDKAKAVYGLSELGFRDDKLNAVKRILNRPEGIFIVTGPTGSGKTTTLYAMLSSISDPTINIMTLEDPVEYELPLIRQTQIRESQGLTFGEGIRNILRQDPDVVFIGEVRDTETAQMALRAAMTGHQVFTTLHTNDALGALPRLYDLGLEPGLLSGNVTGILAQRLVGLNCTLCRNSRKADTQECRLLGADPEDPPLIWDAPGCDSCSQTGISGRTAIAEIIYVDEGLDELIATSATRAAMRAHLRDQGHRTLAEDGTSQVLAGDISMRTLLRAVDLTDRL